MNKQKSLVCLFVLLCFFSMADVITYAKVLEANNKVENNITTLENRQTDIYKRTTVTKEEYDMLYNEVQDLRNEVQNLNSIIETLSSQTPSSNRWDIILTQNEIDLLARIVMLEAGGEPTLGQEAVVEVIFNRLYLEDFPNTLEDVLSQPKQFSTWKNRNLDAATPTDEVYNSIDNVLSGETHILPYETVYFGVSAENKNKQTVIGNHVFCNQY